MKKETKLNDIYSVWPIYVCEIDVLIICMLSNCVWFLLSVMFVLFFTKKSGIQSNVIFKTDKSVS